MAQMNKHTTRTKMNKNDNEYYTQKQDWERILFCLEKYKNKIIYEGFYGAGHTFNHFKEMGFNVIGKEGMDFFSKESEEYIKKSDILVSNPPFTIKYKIMKLLVEKNKPFILILPLSSINTHSFRKCFNDNMNEVSIFIPKGRMKFIKNGEVAKSPSFESCYVCWKIGEDKLKFIN